MPNPASRAEPGAPHLAPDAGPCTADRAADPRAASGVEVTLFTSSFRGACAAARAVLSEAVRLVPSARVIEVNVATDPDAAEAAGVRSTPTAVVRNASGHTVLRAEGVPSLPQVLVALDRAVVAPPR